jgi:protein TonB
LLFPLIYSERLPIVRPWLALTMPLPPAQLPEPVRTATASHSTRPSLSQSRVFQAPIHINRLVDAGTVELEAPPAPCANCVAGGIGNPPPSLGALDRLIVPPPPPVQRAVEQPQAPSRPVSVSGGVQEAKIIKRVIPTYPTLARQARVSGTVRLIGVISKDGTIQQLQIVSGHPLLVNAALDAVKQWIYRPTMLSGQAVEVIAPIDVIFTLSQ